MQEYTGSLANGNHYRVTSYLLEITSPTGDVVQTYDVNDFTGIRRNGSQVVIQRGKKSSPITLDGASLDDAGRIESVIRPTLRREAEEKDRSGRGLRIAVMVISLMLSLIVLFQSCASTVGDSLEGDEEASGGTAAGFLVTLLFIFGGAFVLAKPRVSMILFLIAAAVGIPTGAVSDFSDLLVWGIVAVGLATMCYFSVRRRA